MFNFLEFWGLPFFHKLFMFFFSLVVLMAISICFAFIFLVFPKGFRPFKKNLFLYLIRLFFLFVILLSTTIVIFLVGDKVCGDAICEKGETIENCPQECTYILLLKKGACTGLGKEQCTYNPNCQLVYESGRKIGEGSMGFIEKVVLWVGGGSCTESVIGCVENLQSKCSNGMCEEGETEETCPQDCLKVCPRVYLPVCGGNGKTYSNCCFARKEGVMVACLGSCPCEEKEVQEVNPIVVCGDAYCEQSENETCFRDCSFLIVLNPTLYRGFLSRIKVLKTGGICLPQRLISLISKRH